ncbi:MAG: Smr/MutS family protein [Flavobacteriaceae bacterium]|nr:Smr/MutS family protein [Flavobacteriaceae bacterium]
MTSKFKLGDQVSVIDDTITGKVESIDGTSITIKTIDDFLMKFNENELVIVKEEQREYSKYIDILYEDMIEKDEPKKRNKSRKDKKTKKQPPLEVDLHIHQLTASTRGMNNYDMLNLQIETAKRRLDFAIRRKIPRVVFIHGVGEGVLKKELDFLFARYKVEVYPASFQKYGFGATEVYIYQTQN